MPAGGTGIDSRILPAGSSSDRLVFVPISEEYTFRRFVWRLWKANITRDFNILANCCRKRLFLPLKEDEVLRKLPKDELKLELPLGTKLREINLLHFNFNISGKKYSVCLPWRAVSWLYRVVEDLTPHLRKARIHGVDLIHRQRT